MGVHNTLDRAAKFADAVTSPGGLKAALTWRPFSSSAFRLTTRLHDACGDFATVLDVGANAGQFARAAAQTFPGARVISFEPLSDIAANLRDHLRDLDRFEVHECALGRENGSVEFHPHRYSLSSSALPAVSGNGRGPGPKAATGELPAIDVPLRRLDDIVPTGVARPALLKLDVQGYELEVLAGATERLAEMDALLLELAFSREYVGQPLYGEVVDHVNALGWSLVEIVDLRRDPTGAVAEVDGLFVPTAPTS
jgi:FkbM family methyltransferase